MQDKLASHSQKTQKIIKSTSRQCDGGFPSFSSINISLGSRAPGDNKDPVVLTAFESYFAHPALLLPLQRPDSARQKCFRKLAFSWDHAQDKQKVTRDPHLIDLSCTWRQESLPLLQQLTGGVVKQANVEEGGTGPLLSGRARDGCPCVCHFRQPKSILQIEKLSH